MPVIVVEPSAPTSIEVPALVTPTDRLDMEGMTTVLEIVVDNMIKRNLVGSMEIDAMHMMNETHTLVSARDVWRQIVLRTVIDRIHVEVVKRKLLPVTIHTLAALLLDVVKPFE